MGAWTTERELEIVGMLRNGVSVTQIVKNERTSGRKIIQIKKKYGLWGA